MRRELRWYLGVWSAEPIKVFIVSNSEQPHCFAKETVICTAGFLTTPLATEDIRKLRDRINAGAEITVSHVSHYISTSNNQVQ